jgi:hypothetical protein
LHDGVTTYGNPHGISNPWALQTDPRSDDVEMGIPARFATNAEPNAELNGDASMPDAGGQSFQPLQPYREAPQTPTQHNASASNAPPEVRPMFVGSRTFALEYDVEQVGRSGISEVEL